MRVLVAEDNPTLGRSIARGLRDDGYAVDLTATGDEAAHLLAVHAYDCVLLDIMLPGKSGFDVIAETRQKGIKTPVLCLTARDATEDRVRGLDLGADDYLVKPFEWDELLARVRALIRRTHGQSSSTMRIADLEIDTAARMVKRAGQEIVLSAREYALLKYLATRAGQVVTRSDIWEHLYDQHDQTTSNVVDVYIGYLRNKIDRPFGSKLIQTRRGHGYVLSASAGEEEGSAETVEDTPTAR
jgi:DNA-binding response OmpR family regulator